MEKQAKQTTRITARGQVTEFEAYVENHVPSWMRYADGGHARFEAMYHASAGWLSLSLSEAHSKSSKRTMLTLEPATTRALYEFLKQRFESAS